MKLSLLGLVFSDLKEVLSLSYYDFDHHFWSPQAVCSQTTLEKPNRKVTRSSLLIGTLPLLCIAILTSVLFCKAIENEKINSLNTNEVNSSGLLFSHDAKGSILRHSFLLHLLTKQ